MKSPRQTVESLVAEAAQSLFGAETAPGPYVRPCLDLKHGDFQTNIAMVQGKKAGANPRELAVKLAAMLEGKEIILSPEIAGPGFVNFRLSPQFCEQQIASRNQEERLGVDKIGQPKKIIIDHGGPNVAKEMHVGHLRSSVLGDALARVFRFLGHDVITDNHLGDWGTQFGMVILGFKREGSQEALQNDPFGHLETLYKKIQQESKDNPETLNSARNELLKLQQGDAENLALWNQFVAISKKAMEGIYQRLDISYDYILGESSYNDRLAGIVKELEEKKIARRSEGAVCIFFDDNEKLKDHPFLIQKSDGAFLYSTTDLATVQFREEKFKPDRVLYVVDGRQQMQFQQLFAAAKAWGIHTDLQHIWFGTVLGEDKKPLKTREGASVKLKVLLDEAESRAEKVIAEKRPTIEPEERKRLAQIVGLGALKYADLAQNRNLDYVFNWEKLLSFDGNTAPYLQNAYVRIQSIFRKAREMPPAQSAVILSESAELLLAKKLLDFTDAVNLAGDEYRPHYLCVYLFELATTFHQFYEACPVLTSTPELRASRLVLCQLTAKTLKTGLNLLGISVVDQM